MDDDEQPEPPDHPPRVLSGEWPPFIGRALDLASLERALRLSRLVTAHGPGGVGKTRLLDSCAVRLAEMVGGDLVTVDLTDVDPNLDQVLAELLSRFGLGDNASEDRQARLTRHMRDRAWLLVLDGCDHLVAGPLPGVVRSLLRAVPALRVVVVSRVRLGISGEHVVPVGPLPPDDALRLFSVLAGHVGMSAGPADQATIAELCEAVDRLPKAIEIAAAWLDSMTVDRALKGVLRYPRVRLDTGQPGDPLDTMRAVYDHSAELLSAPERHLWAILGEFHGGFRWESIAAVCEALGVTEGLGVNELLAGLVRASLLHHTDHAGVSRFRMLNTARDYGRGMDVPGLDRDAVRAAHAEFYSAACARAAVDWLGPTELRVLRGIQTQKRNLFGAINWFIDNGQPVRALRMALDIARTRAHVHGARLSSLRDMLVHCLRHHPADEPSPEQVAALSRLAWIAMVQGVAAQGVPLLAQARELSARLERVPPILDYVEGVYACLGTQDREEGLAGIAMLERSIDATGQRTDRHMAGLFLSLAELLHGDTERAVARAAGAVADAGDAGAPWAITWARWVHALALVRVGDLDAAADQLRRGLAAQRDCDDVGGMSGSLWLTALIVAEHDQAAAATLFGASAARQRATGVNLHSAGPLLPARLAAERACRTALGTDAYAATHAAGEALKLPDAVTFALATLEDAERKRTPADTPAAVISDGEARVVELVAKGLSYKAIGEQLNLSARTVETHVRNAAAKAGVHGRAELAAWFLAASERPTTS